MTIWAGFASVSYNRLLQRYLAVFMTTPEFYYTASEDGIHWEPARKLGLLTQNIPGAPQGTWLSYPSLLSLDQPNDRTTTGSGYLYYSSGILNVTSQHMERTSVPDRRWQWALRLTAPGSLEQRKEVPLCGCFSFA